MSEYYYKLPFMVYACKMKAKNYKEAWEKFKAMFPEYNVKKIGTLNRF
jgi:hypothetical protein